MTNSSELDREPAPARFKWNKPRVIYVVVVAVGLASNVALQFVFQNLLFTGVLRPGSWQLNGLIWGFSLTVPFSYALVVLAGMWAALSRRSVFLRIPVAVMCGLVSYLSMTVSAICTRFDFECLLSLFSTFVDIVFGDANSLGDNENLRGTLLSILLTLTAAWLFTEAFAVFVARERKISLSGIVWLTVLTAGLIALMKTLGIHRGLNGMPLASAAVSHAATVVTVAVVVGLLYPRRFWADAAAVFAVTTIYAIELLHLLVVTSRQLSSGMAISLSVIEIADAVSRSAAAAIMLIVLLRWAISVGWIDWGRSRDAHAQVDSESAPFPAS